MPQLIIYITFWTVFALGFIVTFRILQALEIEKYFKKNRNKEIHASYLIITVLVSYLLAKFIIDVIALFPWD